MPLCLECHGTGKIEVKEEIMERCSHCSGTRRLADGSACPHCNKAGEVGSGEFKVKEQICKTCWGSGKVSEGSLTVWFLVRAVPTTLLLLGGGGAAIWASWVFLALPWLTTILIVLFFGGWGGLIYTFAAKLPSVGEISVTNWFLIRAIPTTIAALAVGGAIVGSMWFYSQNAPATAILALGAFAVWGVLMFFFISYLPE